MDELPLELGSEELADGGDPDSSDDPGEPSGGSMLEPDKSDLELTQLEIRALPPPPYASPAPPAPVSLPEAPPLFSPPAPPLFPPPMPPNRQVADLRALVADVSPEPVTARETPASPADSDLLSGLSELSEAHRGEDATHAILKELADALSALTYPRRPAQTSSTPEAPPFWEPPSPSDELTTPPPPSAPEEDEVAALPPVAPPEEPLSEFDVPTKLVNIFALRPPPFELAESSRTGLEPAEEATGETEYPDITLVAEEGLLAGPDFEPFDPFPLFPAPSALNVPDFMLEDEPALSSSLPDDPDAVLIPPDMTDAGHIPGETLYDYSPSIKPISAALPRSNTRQLGRATIRSLNGTFEQVAPSPRSSIEGPRMVFAPQGPVQATGPRRIDPDSESGQKFDTSPPVGPLSPEIPTDALPRYEAQATIGSGGFGIVVEAHDRQLGRQVALKMARADRVFADPKQGQAWRERAEAALSYEARLAGQLEDPRVVPVHDLGRTATGEIYFVMKRVRGRSLGGLLTRMAQADEALQQEYTLNRRLTLFVQICLGMAFVHDQGVVHRDLKPANIMVGEYGEIQIIDWGLARYLKPGPGTIALPDPLRERDETVIQGTPGYMAPEQALGYFEAIDSRTDIYALGAILYELLTFRPPIDTETDSGPISVQLMRIANGSFLPPSRRVPGLFVAEELEAICLKALATEKDDRYSDARALARAIEDYLAGTARKAEAARLAERGLQSAGEYRALHGALIESRRAAQTASERTPRWATPAEKELIWALEDNVAEIARRRVMVYAEAVRSFHEALGYDRESVLARNSLAEVYWMRFEEAEREQHTEDALYYERLVRQYDTGGLAARLQGDGKLLLTTEPAGIEAYLFTYVEIQRQLVPQQGRRLGRTPLEISPIPMGRYLVVLLPPGQPEIRYPVWIQRQQTWEGHVRIPPPQDNNWVFIPGGPCVLGGDREAPGSTERGELELDSFYISRNQVTCAAYCDYLNDLTDEEALHRVPRRVEGTQQSVPCWWKDGGGKWFVPRRDRTGDRWDPNMPITSISWEDATAFTRWLGRMQRARIRLASEAEWEKAARGVDGRPFPWGSHFDPAFCKMSESRPGAPQPEVIGTFASDESPYGVRDMAGGMAEWVNGFFDDQNLLMSVRGGGWSSSAARCRLAARAGRPPRAPDPLVSFRIVREVDL